MNAPTAEKLPREFEIHGRLMVDNYYWLRNKGAENVVKYLEDENAYTQKMTAHTERFEDLLFQEMKESINETETTPPVKYGDYLYYARTVQGKNYRIHCRKLKSLEAKEEVILDENELSVGNEYFNLGCLKISRDQRLLAYTMDFTGGEKYDLHIVDLVTGNTIDKLVGISNGVEWGSDAASVFYAELDDILRPYTVTRHIIGNQQAQDVRLLVEDDTRFYVDIEKTKDQSYLIVYSVNSSAEINEIHTLDLREKGSLPELLLERTAKSEMVVEHQNDYFYILSNHLDAMSFQLFRTTVSEREIQNWELVSDARFITRRPHIEMFRNYLAIMARKDGYANISIYDTKDGTLRDVQMPEPIYALNTYNYIFADIFYFTNPEYNTGKIRFYFSSPITSRSAYEYDMASETLALLKAEEIRNFNPGMFSTERRYAVAEDGTRIPISLAYRTDVRLNGTAPLLLYGYGSYGYPSDPGFHYRYLALLKRGIILAFAHVRGGGEYGKEWYHAGKLRNKMNTFTDFIACAEYLVAEGFTSKERLCAWGGSAGGLLMGAVANLRPDLFKCILATVPFVDVINTMLDESIPLTTFEYNEWGNPNKREEFEWMIEYSPYDNVKARAYPNMLIRAGYNDVRVAYWEPAKWTAKLRSLKTDKNLLLLKTKMDSGHMGATGRYDEMKEFAFNWAFILDVLGLVSTE
jgi:oligopeptidase B